MPGQPWLTRAYPLINKNIVNDKKPPAGSISPMQEVFYSGPTSVNAHGPVENLSPKRVEINSDQRIKTGST